MISLLPEERLRPFSLFSHLVQSAEVIWDLSVGTVAFVALCGPVLLAMASGNKGGPTYEHQRNIFPGCLPAPKDVKNLRAPPLGKRALKYTRDYRCPNVESLALSIEKIAGCYEARSREGDAHKAWSTLKSLEDSKHFYSCISPQTQQRIGSNRQ